MQEGQAVGVELELRMMGKRIGGACHPKVFLGGNRCQEGVRSKGKHMMPGLFKEDAGHPCISPGLPMSPHNCESNL